MNTLLLSLMLAQAPVLPEVDRTALELQARAEGVLARRNRAAPTTHRQATPQPRVATPVRNAARPAQPATRRPASPIRNASGGGNLDLSAITTICRAAGTQADPANFLATLSRAYAMSADQSAALRTSCAAYLAGRADARDRGY